MGRQWNTIIESLGPLSGGTMSITANLTDIEALLTTLQADVADGIIVSSGTTAISNGTLAQLTTGTVFPGQATTGGTGPTAFTSTSFGTIAASNASRRACTIYNAGPSLLYVTLGTATASATSYSVALNSGDYYEVPASYTGLIGGIFSSASTALVTQLT